jgi:hypothetical protein
MGAFDAEPVQAGDQRNPEQQAERGRDIGRGHRADADPVERVDHAG